MTLKQKKTKEKKFSQIGEKPFSSKSSLDHHKKTTHDESKPHKCNRLLNLSFKKECLLNREVYNSMITIIKKLKAA